MWSTGSRVSQAHRTHSQRWRVGSAGIAYRLECAAGSVMRKGSLPGEYRGGRKKGAKNKNGTAKANFLKVFDDLGGTKFMMAWAKENQTEFFKIYGRLIPAQVDIEANVRNCDVSDTPLSAQEWQARFGTPTH